MHRSKIHLIGDYIYTSVDISVPQEQLSLELSFNNKITKNY